MLNTNEREAYALLGEVYGLLRLYEERGNVLLMTSRTPTGQKITDWAKAHVKLIEEALLFPNAVSHAKGECEICHPTASGTGA